MNTTSAELRVGPRAVAARFADALRIMARLQKFREQADHAQAFVVDAAGARGELEAARDLVGRIDASIG